MTTSIRTAVQLKLADRNKPASPNFRIVTGDEFKTGVLVVRHDTVMYQGAEIGKIQYKRSPHIQGTEVLTIGEEQAKPGFQVEWLIEQTTREASFAFNEARRGAPV